MTEASREFWIGGADGELRMTQCTSCRECTYPPAATCVWCGSDTAVTRAASEGTVLTATVCHQQYNPAVPTPFVVALVDLDAPSGARIAANVIGCEPTEVHGGMRVSVRFEQHADAYVPVFVPAETQSG
jgi:uncharacterized OB-fold protein